MKHWNLFFNIGALAKMFRQAKTLRLCACVVLMGLCGHFPAVVTAQTVSSPGRDWSGGWGFSSPSDRSLRLQEAQAIYNAENPQDGPSTVITNNYDNRSNFIDAGGGTIGPIDYHIGDEIGQNTNSVGAMNTGSTTIEVAGDGNIVDAINSADSTGCIDGSVLNGNYEISGNMSEGPIELPGVSIPNAPCQ